MMPVMRSNSWIPSVFNDLFDTDFMPKANCTAPAINVKENDKAYTVDSGCVICRTSPAWG